MDAIEAIKRDKAYVKYKLVVKNWENEFKSKYSRTPSKFDIKEAPSKIKYAYKKYFQIKSSALETSLFENSEEISVSTEKFTKEKTLASEEVCLSSPFKLLNSHLQPESIPSLPTGQELEHLLLTDQNKCHTINSLNNKKLDSKFTTHLSKKLFENRKFCLRNPKKGFSKSLSQINQPLKYDQSLNNDECYNMSIADSESSNDSFDQLNSNENLRNNMPSNAQEMRSTPLRVLSMNWLDRATNISQNNDMDQTSENECKEQTEQKIPKFGLANVKLPQEFEMQHMPDTVQEITEKLNDYIENSDPEAELNDNLDKLQPALKKRKVNESLSLSVTKRSDQKFKTKKLTKKKSISKSSTRDDSTELPPDLVEYLPFGVKEKIYPRHVNPAATLANIEKLSKSNNKSEEEEKLEKKVLNATLNENFVKINIEKKVFVRGKKSVNYSKYKKQQWKDKKALHASMEFPDSGKITCFKCGNFGHMARYCTAHKGDALLPLTEFTEKEIPTLEEMQDFINKEKNNIIQSQQIQAFDATSIIPDYVLQEIDENDKQNTKLQPIYSQYPPDVENNELVATLHKFGHASFRPGQEEAIKRILCGLSTLLILSTGSGKSICYQLPAYIYHQKYKCITLVISPLVSLMEDQVLSMPEFLKAACLHTNQTSSQRSKILQCLKDGEISILLISPEALISGDGTSGFRGLFKSLPEIAFACIDEAHCVSQWSHNFRPSYLVLCRVLQEKLNVKCILGLSATASQTSIKSIIRHIGIPDSTDGVISNPSLPDNLTLAVSYEKDKDKALLHLLTSKKISAYNSIIVYCIRRDECERVAALLRSCLQTPGGTDFEKESNRKRKRMSYVAEAYHAGMSAYQRKKVQKNFMDGALRIIVSTVAFGMGINKSNIRCIVHYNMPSSFESYVQEVGRAGRDSNPAYCHTFINENSNDKDEILRYIHSNTIDRPTIRKLLQKVFVPCECSNLNVASTSTTSNKLRCGGHEVAIPIDSTIEELDLPSENIETLLCYIELHPKQFIKVLNKAYTVCKITSYGGPQSIIEATKRCPPLAMAYLMERKRNPEIIKQSVFEFQVIEIASIIGWESGMTKFQLKNLEWTTDGGHSQRTPLRVEFNTLGFRIKAAGNLNATELDNILNDIHNTVLLQEKAMLYQVEEIHNSFRKLGNYSLQNEEKCFRENFLFEKSNELKQIIRNYFERDDTISSSITLKERPLDEERVRSDVKALIVTYKDCTFNGRSVARIFQGISSPNFPAIVWGRCKFWRSHIHEDFYGLMKVATQEIIKMKGL